MTAEEKAKELIGKFYKIEFNDDFGNEEYETLSHKATKQCALISVDEIMDIFDKEGYSDEDHKIKYWQEVKAEIEKL